MPVTTARCVNLVGARELCGRSHGSGSRLHAVRAQVPHAERLAGPLLKILINAVEIQDYLEQAPSDWDGLVNKAFAMKEEITPLQNAEVDNIKDEMEVLGPIRLTEVQEAQKAVINVARTMSDEGTIVLAGRGGDDFV